jgi:hypothetical protein
MLNIALSRLNDIFGVTGIHNAAGHVAAFAPGQPLRTDIVFPRDQALGDQFQEYIDSMPGAVRETIRGAIYHALSASPPSLMTFMWSPAYDFDVTVAQFPDTTTGAGAITVHVRGRYPSDANTVREIYRAQALADAEPRSAKMGSPKPAKRKASKRSKKSSGRA